MAWGIRTRTELGPRFAPGVFEGAIAPASVRRFDAHGQKAIMVKGAKIE